MASRREFLKTMAAASFVASAPKFSFAQAAPSGKTFIKVFQRGGADGLHLFPRHNDPFYHEYRPDIAIPAPGTDSSEASLSMGVALERSMNPNLAPLWEIWNDGNMMLAPSTSFAGSNRSHFTNQAWIATGTSESSLLDGYLNRYMQLVPGTDHVLRGLSGGQNDVGLDIRGNIPVAAIHDSSNYDLKNSRFCGGTGCSNNQLTEYMRSVAQQNEAVKGAERLLYDTHLTFLDTIEIVREATEDYVPSDGVTYSNSELGRGLQMCAQLLKAGIPLEVALLDWNIGWDTHDNQVSVGSVNPITDPDKRYNAEMLEGANDFLTFYRDMGDAMKDVVVLVGSEFGRNVRQNGSFGTDHGEGGAWFAFGGPTQSRIAADVGSLELSTLGNRNWLPIVTSCRDIIGEILHRHLGMEESLISTVLPGHQFVDLELFKT